MSLFEIKATFHQLLDSIYGKDEVDSLFFLSIDFYLNLSRTDYVLNIDATLSHDKQIEFKNLLNQLKKETPIQYIFGETEFFGLKFKVTPDVLIPRQETEELVDWVMRSTKLEVGSMKLVGGSVKCKVSSAQLSSSTSSSSSSLKPKVLDIGTGSGCMAISLAKHLPNAEVYAIDISKKAIDIAKYNAIENEVDVTFIQADFLRKNMFEYPLLQNINFDIIVSNPPYVRHKEKSEMKPNVLEHEPHLALFVDDKEPLIFYQAIATFAKQKLKDQGLLFFEINQYLGNETVALLKTNTFKCIELRKDLNGNERMVKAGG